MFGNIESYETINGQSYSTYYAKLCPISATSDPSKLFVAQKSDQCPSTSTKLSTVIKTETEQCPTYGKVDCSFTYCSLDGCKFNLVKDFMANSSIQICVVISVSDSISNFQ